MDWNVLSYVTLSLPQSLPVIALNIQTFGFGSSSHNFHLLIKSYYTEPQRSWVLHRRYQNVYSSFVHIVKNVAVDTGRDGLRFHYSLKDLEDNPELYSCKKSDVISIRTNFFCWMSQQRQKMKRRKIEIEKERLYYQYRSTDYLQLLISS